MSHGLAPSKTTVYASNLPFSLTNNDLHKIFEKYGKVVKVTILKDQNRRSKGVAFILFLEREPAFQAVRALNNTQMFGRNIKCSMAKDNGRASEFIKKKDYPDKSRCYECGEFGHMSYECSKNLLGTREPPKKKEKKKKRGGGEEEEDPYLDDSDNEVTDDPRMDSLAAAIKYEQARKEEDQYKYAVALGDYASGSQDDEPKKKRFKKDAYFSDEEELEDN